MYKYKAKIVRVVDGDTFDATVDLGFTVSVLQRFRVADIDTPESWRPKTESERIHGKEATAHATSLLEGKDVIIESTKAGKYGRYLAKVTLPDGEDYAQVMIKAGFQKRANYSDDD